MHVDGDRQVVGHAQRQDFVAAHVDDWRVRVATWNCEHPGLLAAERLSIANTALQHLELVMKEKPNAPSAFTYTNLVYRERALGQPDAVSKEADLAKAREYHQKATALQKGAVTSSGKGGN